MYLTIGVDILLIKRQTFGILFDYNTYMYMCTIWISFNYTADNCYLSAIIIAHQTGVLENTLQRETMYVLYSLLYFFCLHTNKNVTK